MTSLGSECNYNPNLEEAQVFQIENIIKEDDGNEPRMLDTQFQTSYEKTVCLDSHY